LEPERLGEAPHDALAPLGERELQFDAPPGRPLAELRHPHRPTVDRDRAPESRRNLGRRPAVRPQPVGARHREARVHEPVRRRPGSTLMPSVVTWPSTRTRPARISSSALRRDVTPARARARCRRIIVIPVRWARAAEAPRTTPPAEAARPDP